MLLAIAPTGNSFPNETQLRIAYVQGGGPQGTRATNTSPRDVVLRHLIATKTLSPDQKIDVVIWPENVVDVPTFANSREAKEIAIEKLKSVGLGARVADLHPSELSGGMQKRAAIARAMALDPKILFLYEPSAGLDPITSADLDSTILDLSKNLGFTFVIVSHELASIYSIADKVIMLDKDAKGIIAEGDPKVLRDTSKDPRVHQFFNRIMSKEAA